LYYFFFFFSSRRRHTRSDRDWSSDVCSSDLDLRFDEFGAGGHPYMKTPHADRIAREGALFERAFHTTPICSPNRASILTGQYARSEERRVGKECRSRGSWEQYKKDNEADVLA